MRTMKVVNDEQFSVYWMGFNLGSQGIKGLDNLEKAVRVLRKLKGISIEKANSGAPAGIDDRELAGEGAVLTLEEDEYNSLLQSCEGAPWLPAGIEKAYSAIKILKEIKPDMNELGVDKEAEK